MKETTQALNALIKVLYDNWQIDGNEISDTIHSFGELYEYRMLYNAIMANLLYEKGLEVYKTKKHNDKADCFGGGWFLVCVRTPYGPIDNHYELKYWDLFKVKEEEFEPYPYDGHTPKDVVQTLYEYIEKEM